MQKLNRIFISGLLCMASCMVFFGCKAKEDDFFVKAEDTELTTELLESQSETSDVSDFVEADNTPYCVYVCGSVYRPGIYELSPGSRINEAIEMAGGFTDEACDSYWNLAELVYDGQMIFVPTQDEATDRDLSSYNMNTPNAKSDSKININTASKELLTSISGIGNGRAENIIKYREKNGGFATVDDIKNVSGIGDLIFENIKDFITVN